VLEAVELPASITNLNTSLTNMNRNDFTHVYEVVVGEIKSETDSFRLSRSHCSKSGSVRKPLS
jgi:hypothetical protein